MGTKFYNDFLMQAGPLGNVQSELLFRKDQATFTFDKGWAFPRRIYFNGDNCVMPPPDAIHGCQILVSDSIPLCLL
ncbi:COBRA-like protein 1 [Prunus yedoensis var. nudiflora]|uniref:COBRA-like protein 1 n=1 Tax=Prunus yedoensis var. nudiflora TaxID=2094558 RepID=A0A314XU72_PRUYE|nr:COBRA-like protein 1 [Prunus yedoensis var. nudiflora]